MGNIVIVGTGWTAGQLTLDAADALKRGARVILHSERSGCADWLRANGIAYESLDGLYERCEDFDEHLSAAVSAVLDAAEHEDVVYGVFDVRDRTANALVERDPKRVRILAGPPAEGELLAYASGDVRCIEASDWESVCLSARENCLIRELDSRELAAEVKLRLSEVYPEESRIWLMIDGEAPFQTELYRLDRLPRYDHRTCVLVPAQREITALERYDFEHLNEIMRRLCAPDGCPWDRAQTHESLKGNMVEEAYEVVDAIDAQDPEHLYDELGDTLMQIALHAEIARRHGEFDIGDVTTAICSKMISRHTHIFGGDRADSAEEVLDLWSRNKMAERGQTTHTQVLRSVTRALPALMRAVKVLRRSADAGLCEADAAAPLTRCVELLGAVPSGGDAARGLGDALLSLCDATRLLGVDPELALNDAVNRFVERFAAVEAEILRQDEHFENFPAEKLREYWDLVKL